MSSKPRVVLDTNVLISGAVYSNGVPGKIVRSMRDGVLDVVLSRYILDELGRVLPAIKQLRMTREEVSDFIIFVSSHVQVVAPAILDEPQLRDVNDREVLGTLVASSAQLLITGDKDLLALSTKYPIMSPSEFWALHG